MCQLAKAIHGSLVPEVSFHGQVDGANPPLTIYTMPYLQGTSCLDALACEVEMDEETEAKHICFIRHLARYFSRCLSSPERTTIKQPTDTLNDIQRRLGLVRTSPLSIIGTTNLLELESRVGFLFGLEYPQVLTHGDFSRTNILVDEDTYEIKGIVDWSLASVLPFGIDLDCLLLMTGYLDLDGWHNYACSSQMHEAFWEELWSASDITDGVLRHQVRDMAEQAAKIGTILRYAFQHNADGSPSEILMPGEALSWKYLQA